MSTLPIASLTRVTDRFLLLSGHPYLGRGRDQDIGRGSRSLPVGEYVIVYCIEGEDVLILRVAHGRVRVLRSVRVTNTIANLRMTRKTARF